LDAAHYHLLHSTPCSEDLQKQKEQQRHQQQQEHQLDCRKMRVQVEEKKHEDSRTGGESEKKRPNNKFERVQAHATFAAPLSSGLLADSSTGLFGGSRSIIISN